MKFHESLKKARKKAKLTQEALAKLCHVTQGTVANWECGRREPDIDTINLISTVLNVPFDYLFDKKTDVKKVNTTPNLDRWERAMDQYADMSPEEQKRIDAVLDAFFPDDTKPSGIIHETTIGAEQDRRAATDEEAEETAV